MTKTKRNLYLGEIIERDKVEYGNNNLIKAPVGSGKTYLMHQLSEAYEGKKLMLVSSTALKDKFSATEGIYTTQDLRENKVDVTNNENIYVMTYAEFGGRIKWNNDFMHKFSVIFCDEIHSLFDYYFIEQSITLAATIKGLFASHKNTVKFYFTATTYELDRFIDKEYDNLYQSINLIDYSESKDIVRYVAYVERKFSGTHGIKEVILELTGLKIAGKKGVIYNDRIDSMEIVQKMLKKIGYSSISIWSVNNTDRPMNSEQLHVRKILLEEEVIPAGYDFVIINGAMREGWDLKDPDVEVVILNTLNITSKEQAFGRVRKDISLLYTRSGDKVSPLDERVMNKERSLGIIESYLGEELNRDMQEAIAEEFDIRREENNLLVKWRGISDILKKNGYSIESKRIREGGKQSTVHIVTRTEHEVKPSVKSRSSNFLARLSKTKFAEVNKEFLANYINKSNLIAYSNIKTAYEKFVGVESWTERKFTDVVYLLAADREIFSKDNFVQYGVNYHDNEKIKLVRERAKYEVSAKGHLQELEEKKMCMEEKENEELLRYIAEHGGK